MLLLNDIKYSAPANAPFGEIAQALRGNEPVNLMLAPWHTPLIFTPQDKNYYWLGIHLRTCLLINVRNDGIEVTPLVPDAFAQAVRYILLGVNKALLEHDHASAKAVEPDGMVRLRLHVDE